MKTTERFHSLDALRGLALLLGIVLHATMSFFFFLPAQDVSQSTTLAVTFYVIHIFRMSVFYLIAGFFAHLVFHRRGARAFVKDRAKRIVVPMIAGWVLLAPLTIGAVIWGLSRTFPDATGATSGEGPGAPQGFPLTHLWFLYYLCLFYVATLALRAGVVALDRGEALRNGVDRLVRTAISSRLAPLALALPTIAVLFADKGWAAWFGIHTPDTGLAPQLPALVAYGSAFAFGWLLHRQSDLLATLERQWRGNLTAAVALTAACLAWIGPTPNLLELTTVPGGVALRLAYTAGYALAIWCWTFGLLGASVRFFSRQSPARRYLADASYWFYLVHLPIVFALQVLLMKVPLHWSLKFPAILAVTFGLLLASYHYLVRSTFVGEILNGRRYPRMPRQPQGSPQASDGGATTTPLRASRAEPAEALALSTGSPIAELVHVTKRYGKTVALDDLSLAVRPGELLAVLGPNGAGKSTAIGLWLGTLQPDDGERTIVRVMGGSPLEVASRLAVGVMMQEVTLAPMLTAREQVALAASYYRDPLPVADTLAFAGIEELAGKRYGKLSAGQKRQVQFALAIVGRPRLLFLDEPTVGLDVAARETMWKNIRRLVGDGCSIVLTTHYLEEAEALADRVAVLANGRLIADGSVDEMRSLVTRKRIRCTSALALDEIRRWPGVVDVERNEEHDGLVEVTASDAESVVRRLLAADPALGHLEVRQASLAEAFTELTKEAA
ncbi:MAG: acyltransferase family protein [Thermoanaerobaculia bacterium]